MKAGRYDDAQEQFGRAAMQSPDNLEARYQLALADLKVRQIRPAYNVLRAAEERDRYGSSVSLPIRIELAKLFIGAKKYDLAETRLLRVLERDPHHSEARALLATVLAAESKPEAARQQVDLLLSDDPANLTGRVLDATLDLFSQKSEEAEASLVRETELTNRSTDSLKALANFYQLTRQGEKAAGLLNEILARQPQDVALRMQLGALYGKMGDRAGAEKNLREAAKMAPANREAARALSAYYIRIGDWPAAAAELEADAKKNSGDTQTRSLLAAVYYRGGRRDDAKRLTAQLLSTKDSGAHLLNGVLHLDAKEFDEAIAEFDFIVRDHRDSVPATYLLGLAQHGAGREQVAVQQMEHALYLEPDMLPARLWLIDYHLRRGSNNAALDMAHNAPENQAGAPEIVIFRALADANVSFSVAEQTALHRALLARPDFIPAYENYGMTTLLRKYGAPLRDDLEKLVKKSPEYQPARALLMAVLEAQGQTDRAIVHAALATAAHPERPSDWLTLARLQMDHGRLDAARTSLEKAAAAQPESLAVGLRRAQVEFESGHFDEASRLLAEVTQRDPRSCLAWTFQGILFEQHGDLEKARGLYETALKCDSRDPVAANNFALLLATSFHDLPRALDLAKRAHQIDPTKPEFADTFGWITHLSGDSYAALDSLSEAVRMMPNVAAFRYHLGVAQSRVDRIKEAVLNLETALRLDPQMPEAGEAKTVLATLGVR